MPAPKITPEISAIIIDLYSNDKLGAQAISDILLDDYNITLSRAPVGKHIKKLIANKTIVKVPGAEKAATIAQRSKDFGKKRKVYRVVRPVTEWNRTQNPNLPADANFKVQIRRNKKSEMIYTKTKAEAERAIAETTVVPVDPKDAKARGSKTRQDNLKLTRKGSSQADKLNEKTIQDGIKKLNKYFKNSPELINTTDFGRNIKTMMALRLDRDTDNFYSRLKPDSYYLKKAKQGDLFHLFDVAPVAGQKKGGRYATNMNVVPGQFNSAFVQNQLTNLFKRGVNEETANQLDDLLNKYNVRVEMPEAGKIGAKAGVAFDSVTGKFPQIEKTLQSLEAPQEIKNLFVQEATVPNSPICKIVAKRKADGGRIAFANGSNCAIEVASKFDEDPIKFAQDVNKLPEEAGAFNKIKNAASKFLSVAKKGGRFGVTAAVGAVGAGLVKEFMNDDPSTYLSDENQQKNMLIDMITQPVLEPSMEPTTTAFGDAQLPAIGAVAAAGAIPGGAELYRQRIKSPDRRVANFATRGDVPRVPRARVSPFRAALGPLSGVLGKGLATTGTPLGMLALEPLYIGQQIADGDSLGEVATNPLNYLGPAFAGSLSKEATRFAGPKMANIMRLGISPTMLKTVSRRFGLPGLGISAGISGYEMYQNKKAGRGLFDDG